MLIDGYRRVPALRRLGRDTARVQRASGTVAQALAPLLASAQSRSLAAIEQALLLREVMDGQHLSASCRPWPSARARAWARCSARSACR